MTEIALLRLASDAARHAAARQTVIATNVANADTPGYQARDVAPFYPAEDAMPLRRSHSRHMAGVPSHERLIEDARSASDPNGNTVSLQDQVLRGIDASRAHNRALRVYQSSLDMLRASIGRQ